MAASFYQDLRTEVFASLAARGRDGKADAFMKLKFVLYLAAIIGLYAAILSGRFSGVPLVIIGLALSLSIMAFMVNSLHDIMHGSFSHHPGWKRNASYLLDLLGPSSFI